MRAIATGIFVPFQRFTRKTSRNSVLAVLALLMLAVDVRADCTLDPTVGIGVVIDEEGMATATVSYGFPDTTSSGQRDLWVTAVRAGTSGAAHLGQVRPGDVSGTQIFEHDLSCQPPGTWTYTAHAISCGSRSKEGTTTASISTDPTVNIVYTGPDDQGNGTVLIGYNFPNTSDPNQRALDYQLITPDGPVAHPTYYAPQQEGQWSFPYSMACLPTGTYTHKVTLRHCNGMTRTATHSTTIASNPKVTVTTNGPDPDGNVTFTLAWEFPNSSSGGHVEPRVDLPSGPVAFQGFTTTQRYGQASFGFSVACQTGPVAFVGMVRSCSGETDDDRKVVSVNSRPTVSLAYSETNGGVASIGYNFPNAGAATNRLVDLYIDGGFAGSYHAPTATGVWTPTVGMCWKKLRVVATACGNSQSRDEKQLDQSDKPKEPLTVALLKAGAGLIEATITWKDLVVGSTINVNLQNWTNAAGQQIPGGFLGSVVAQTASGTGVVNFAAPFEARQLSVVATGSTACGIVTGDASIACDPCEATANPVYWSDGNMRLTDGEPLPPIGGHRLSRTYDSEEQDGGLFGRGWTTLFERRLIAHDDGAISILSETNEVVTFRTILGAYRQTWPQSGSAIGTLFYDSGAGTYTYRAPGATETAVFRATDGRLIVLRDAANGSEATIAYDAQGQPTTFTDTITGVAWNLTVGSSRRVTSISVIGYPALTWTYLYDTSGNMTSVAAPGNIAWRTYEYAANRMTASYDALGHLIESHTYDANGRAITSVGDIDEIANLEYGLPGPTSADRVTRVTYKNGSTSEYTLRAIGSAWRPVAISGGCASCGTHDVTFVHDVHGRKVREQGADGYVTATTYASGRMQSQQRALKPAGCDPSTDPQHCRLGPDELATAVLEATESTVTTTYEYFSASWPDRMTGTFRPSVASPNDMRRETYTYHPVTGAVASTIVRGWIDDDTPPSDRVTSILFYGDAAPPCGAPSCPPYDPYAPAFAPGGSFQTAWLALPQPAYRSKSADGPRSDVDDVSSLVYYPIHTTVPALLRGRLAATKNAAGHITRYEDYDVFGNITRTVDPNGVTVTMTYDDLGRLLTSTTQGVAGCNTTLDPLCATDVTSTRAYTSGAGPLRVDQRPGGGVTAYTYDSRGRIHTISRGPSETDLRERIETTYDPSTGKKDLERTLAFESGAWQEKRRQSFAYDSHARLQTITHADGAAIHHTYDAEDRLATIRDENHAAPNTFYAYDPAGRLKSVKQTLAEAPAGFITTEYAYDTDGNPTSATDPNGNITEYRFDDFGQMISQVSQVTGTTTYEYDPAGNLLETTDANGAVTTRVYDPLQRVTSATSTRGSATEVVSWSYDDTTANRFAIGRTASMTDPSGSTQYHYERRGLLREETRTLTGAQYPYTTGFLYDADGNRTVVKYPSTQLTVTYGFDYAGRPTSASNIITSATYLPFGPLTQLNYATTMIHQMTYDSRYRMISNKLLDASAEYHGFTTTALPSPVERESYSYRYDAAGNITHLLDTHDSAFSRRYNYDDLSRLTSANSGSSLWGSGAYTWDAMGNMTSMKLAEVAKDPIDPLDEARTQRQRLRTQENAPRGRSSTFTYVGTTPRLLEVTTNDISRTVTYDAAGNEVTYAVARAYSPRNHLIEVLDPGEPEDPLQHRINYAYDGRGVRVIRAESPADGPGTFALRFSIYTPELQLMAVTKDDASNVWAHSAADKNIDYEIVWFAGRPVAQVTPAVGKLYYFTDHIGTPILQFGTTGLVSWRAEYDPFGNVWEMREGTRTRQPLRFPGQEVAMNWEGQEENYNIFRWYKSGWGRYTQADPIGLKGGLNLYSYVGGNPLSNIDPKGLAPIGETKTDCPCITCPTGGWYQYGGTVSGMLKFVGGGVSVYRFRCPSGGLECDFITVCGKGGAGVYGSAVLGVGFTLFAYCESELSGWSFGPDVDLGYGYAGSASSSIGSAGTFGATLEPGGIGGGVGGGMSLCYAFKLGCRKY